MTIQRAKISELLVDRWLRFGPNAVLQKRNADGSYTTHALDDLFGVSRASVAAAGTTAANATAMTAQVNLVTAADGTKGVALPAAATTIGPILVINSVESADLKVYPVSGGNDDINGGAEDAAVLLRPGRAAWFIPITATDWYVDPSALQFNAGQLVTGAGVGITAGSGTIYRNSVVREGGIIKTSILLDLTGLSSATDDLDIIGVAGGPAHIGQILAEHNGTILTGRMTCIETPSSLTDIDLYAATVGTGAFEDLVTDLTETALLTKGGAWSAGQTTVLSAMPAANAFLYLVNGAADTADPFTAGKFLIELEGYDA
jgi:hypothetical protein